MAAAGIDDIRAELLPADKTTAIGELPTRGPVAMVGDGINDGPGLATADVGITMGAAGTDVAIEAADIAIMGDHLTHLPDLVEHARRTRRIMIQNLVLSGAIIGVLIPVATFGWLRPWRRRRHPRSRRDRGHRQRLRARRRLHTTAAVRQSAPTPQLEPAHA